MYHKHYLVALSLVSILAPAAIRAEMPITTSDTPPSGPTLLLAHSTTEIQGYTMRRGAGPEVGVGQTFRLPTDSTLSKITVRLGSDRDMAGLPVSLMIGRFSDPEDGSMNTPLWSGSGRLPSGSMAAPIYVTFELGGVPLESGQQYGFLLRMARGGGRSGPARADVLHLSEDAYPDGRPFLLEGADYKPLYDDLVFFLTGEAASHGTSAR